MCGSTSVACCPGAIVYGSELICVRFAPTGFPGGVGLEGVEGDDEPEHPISASVHKARKKAKPVRLKTSAILKGPGNVAPPSRRLSWRRPAATCAGKMPALRIIINGLTLKVNRRPHSQLRARNQRPHRRRKS